MNKTMVIDDFRFESKALSLSDLTKLYNGIFDELRACANAKPKKGFESKETDQLEAALLDWEDSLLSQAAAMTLSNQQDVLNLMDLWSKATGFEAGQEGTQSDRIVNKIFRYIPDVSFPKEH
jgi:hypothetical protein